MNNALIKASDGGKYDLTNPVKGAQVVQFMESTNASMRVDRFRESIGPDDFDYIMTDKMNARLARGWAQWEIPWQELVAISEQPDMLENYVYRVGALNKVDKLDESGGVFQEFDAPDDAEISYAVSGFGNLLVADFKTIKTDRLGWFGKVSEEAGRAASKRFYHWLFVAKLQDNPTVDDGNALFDETYHDNDLDGAGNGVTLNYSNLSSAWDKMAGQTDNEGDPIFVQGAYLVVGESNEIAARTLVESEMNPSSSTNDRNFFYGKLKVIVVPWLGSDWYLWTDSSTVETFEVGFLDGNVDPALYMLNPDVSDTYFRTKKNMWRVEHYYGGDWIDWRGVVRGSQDV